MKVYGIQNWQVFQQINGKADINIKGEADGWLVNPVLEMEKKFFKMFYGAEVRCIDERTGEVLSPWISAKAENGKWECTIEDIPVGGPYAIQMKNVFFDGNEFIKWEINNAACHIGVGDIYIITGQSNAQGRAHGLHFDSPDMNVRKLDSEGNWEMACHPFGDGGLHNPFMIFAKLLTQKLGYPIGIIPRAIGGSPITSWISGGEHIEKIRRENIGKIKGVLWYQGCNEAVPNNVDGYEEKFMNYLNTIRQIFKDDSLPVITFQLNRFFAGKDIELKDEGYENIREIQRRMPYKAENVYVIPTIDLKTMSDDIHNSVSSNRAIGERAAMLALDVIYNKVKAYKAPELVQAKKIKSDEIELTFSNVVGNLYSFNASADLLPICIEDNKGKNNAVDYSVNINKIIIKTERNIEDETHIKIHCGANPQYVIIDLETQLPIICFKNVKLS